MKTGENRIDVASERPGIDDDFQRAKAEADRLFCAMMRSVDALTFLDPEVRAQLKEHARDERRFLRGESLCRRQETP